MRSEELFRCLYNDQLDIDPCIVLSLSTRNFHIERREHRKTFPEKLNSHFLGKIPGKGFLAVTVLLLMAGFPSKTLLGQDSVAQQQGEPSIEKLSDTVYRIGTVILDQGKNEISVEGKVNMQSGMIEYLACARRGKLHESVLVLDAEPYQLQVALLLFGLEPGGGLEYQGDPRTPQGDSLEIWVEWEEEGKTKRHRIEDFVYNIARKRTMRHTPWIFVGSRVVDGTFMADVERSIIATYHDPMAIIDNPLPTGADDTLYQANHHLVPERGTPVTVFFKPLKSAAQH